MQYLISIILILIITCPPCVDQLVCDILNDIGLDPNQIFCPEIVIIPKPVHPTSQQMWRFKYLAEHWLKPSWEISIGDNYVAEFSLPDVVLTTNFPCEDNKLSIHITRSTFNFSDWSRILNKNM